MMRTSPGQGKLVWANLGPAARTALPQPLRAARWRHRGQASFQRPPQRRREPPRADRAGGDLIIEFWATLEGLNEHHGHATATGGLEDVLAGPPAASVWEQASGFAEW
jgi:hypothetical protein